LAGFAKIAVLNLLDQVSVVSHPFVMGDIVETWFELSVPEDIFGTSDLKGMYPWSAEIYEIDKNELLKQLEAAKISDPAEAVQTVVSFFHSWYMSEPTDFRFELGMLEEPGYYGMNAIMLFFRVPYEEEEQSVVFWEDDAESKLAQHLFHDIFVLKSIFHVSESNLQTALGRMFARRQFLGRF
jgi:hypothetical protein